MKTSPTMVIWWKEIRAILPVWIGVLAAMWLPSLLEFRPLGMDQNNWVVLVHIFGLPVLAAIVWAGEFQDRTMIWQLVQPVRRLTVLGRKVLLLATVLGTTTLTIAALHNSFSPLSNDVLIGCGL